MFVSEYNIATSLWLKQTVQQPVSQGYQQKPSVTSMHGIKYN